MLQKAKIHCSLHSRLPSYHDTYVDIRINYFNEYFKAGKLLRFRCMCCDASIQGSLEIV